MTSWRMSLGKRLVKAVTPDVTEEECGGFQLFGGQTWCLKAMRGEKVLGLSYGCFNRDFWSEQMSNKFHIPTRLYDCFGSLSDSPTMAGTAPNATGPGGCKDIDGPCYEKSYRPYSLCLGPRRARVAAFTFDTLHEHLKNRGLLSVHVKIDSAGAVWSALEQLLLNKQDLRKIRSLDLQISLSAKSELDPRRSQKTEHSMLLERVHILEQLLETFSPVGSTLELRREQWKLDGDCEARKWCPEPIVHLRSIPLNEFSVSYVNRDLLEEEEEEEAAAFEDLSSSDSDSRTELPSPLGTALDPMPAPTPSLVSSQPQAAPEQAVLPAPAPSSPAPAAPMPAPLLVPAPPSPVQKVPTPALPPPPAPAAPVLAPLFVPAPPAPAQDVPTPAPLPVPSPPPAPAAPGMPLPPAAALEVVGQEESPALEADGCGYTAGKPQSARPGTPCLPPAAVWPYATRTAWRAQLGERVLAAATPQIVDDMCEGFVLSGDQVWCKKAMRSESTLGLSYGVGARDFWSEMLSNQFHATTRLFDCRTSPQKSPPLGGTAPNATGSCTGRRDPCYERPYWPVRACLGGEETQQHGQQLTTLRSGLQGREQLSTHVKIQMHDGSEWAALEELLSSDQEQEKVRSLDVKVVFGRGAGPVAKDSGINDEQNLLAWQVSILERLLRKFWVTGSTLEVYREGWTPEVDCPTKACQEPAILTPGGFGLTRFAMSLVNKKLT